MSRSTVGPGTLSARSYHRLSCDGQKYGPLKTSCSPRICTPFLPASSIIGMCLSNIASAIFATGMLSSLIGLLAWMSPALTMRGMAILLVPAGDDDLRVGEEADRVRPVRLEVAEEALLRAA